MIETTKKAFVEDKLNLKDFAENLKHLILSSDNPEVFSVNASWGMGKTFFIDNLKLLIEEHDEAICIKYNAWESDYFDDPFVPLLNEMVIQLNKLIEELKTEFELDTKLKQDIQAAKSFIDKLKSLDYSFSLGFSLGITGNISAKNSKADDIFTKYKNYTGNLRNFKEALSLYQKEINKPIIIFIDELDRCRPDYAIKTLEVVKHFFVENDEDKEKANIKFVVAIDREQIINLVKTMYGCYDKEHNIDGYLRKFFDIDFYIPEPDLELYSMFLFNKYKFKELYEENMNPKSIIFYTEFHNFHKFVKSSCEPLNLSLRDLERIYFKFDKVIRLIDCTFDLIIFDLLFLMIVLRHHCIDLYTILIKKPIISGDKYHTYFNRSNSNPINIKGLFDPVKASYNYINKPKEERGMYPQNDFVAVLNRYSGGKFNVFNIANYPQKIEFIESSLSIIKKAKEDASRRNY